MAFLLPKKLAVLRRERGSYVSTGWRPRRISTVKLERHPEKVGFMEGQWTTREFPK